MEPGAEKRICHRFEIPGGQGKYKKTGLLVTLGGYSKAYPVVNVSKGGLAFVCEETLGQDTKVLVQLMAPQEEPLELRGKVRWQGRMRGREEVVVGVQFEPFGGRSGWNPMEALEVLRRLDAKYGEGGEESDDGGDAAKQE